MRIKKITIKNYRSIEQISNLEITKLYALIGKNNTGKSAIIDAMQAFWGNVEPDAVREGSVS